MNKHGGYYGSQENVCDFSVNLNPLGIPASVKEKLTTIATELVNYPEINSFNAREELAQHLSQSEGIPLERENILMGNGATELIYLFARCFKPKEVLIVQPTFNEYERAFAQSGGNCRYFHCLEKNDFQLESDALIETIQRNQPDVVVLCNPNNPTAAYIHSGTIEKILAAVEHYNGYVFLDESFYEFERQATAISYYEKNIFIVRSMTKYYAIAGIRLGYGIGSTTMIQALEEVKEPWTLNSLATAIVPTVLHDQTYQQESTQWYEKEKAWMKQELERIPYLTVYPSATNYFFCKTALHSTHLFEKLLEEGLFIRTCEDFVGLEHHYIRLAVKNHFDNIKLIEGLKKHIGGHYVK
jgi:threonine-phosphate decarboxylase